MNMEMNEDEKIGYEILKMPLSRKGSIAERALLHWSKFIYSCYFSSVFTYFRQAKDGENNT
jgi:hypothetical protein